MTREEKRINNKCNFIDNLLLDNGLYKGVSALVEIEEHISNLYDEIDNYKNQLEEKDKVIDEAMEYFIEDCPYSIAFKNEEEYKKVQKLCNCENCQDDYKKCWLKYLESEILERGKNVNSK